MLDANGANSASFAPKFGKLAVDRQAPQVGVTSPDQVADNGPVWAGNSAMRLFRTVLLTPTLAADRTDAAATAGVDEGTGHEAIGQRASALARRSSGGSGRRGARDRSRLV